MIPMDGTYQRCIAGGVFFLSTFLISEDGSKFIGKDGLMITVDVF